MGADGGLMWLEVTDEKELRSLVWMLYEYENRQCKAIKYCDNYDEIYGPEGWLEGGYGTDCDHDFESLVRFIDYCLCDSHHYYFHDGDPRLLTFEELMEDILTRDVNYEQLYMKKEFGDCVPWYLQRKWGPITYSLFVELSMKYPTNNRKNNYLSKSFWIPREFLHLTVREWATKVKALLPGGLTFEETWT